MIATLTYTVTDQDTAAAVGSGDLPVLGTPRLVAWAEAATCAAVAEELSSGQTSVGTVVALRHSRASAVGEEVTVRAEVTERDGARLRFAVSATDSSGAQVGEGEVHRAIVDREKFLSRL